MPKITNNNGVYQVKLWGVNEEKRRDRQELLVNCRNSKRIPYWITERQLSQIRHKLFWENWG